MGLDARGSIGALGRPWLESCDRGNDDAEIPIEGPIAETRNALLYYAVLATQAALGTPSQSVRQSVSPQGDFKAYVEFLQRASVRRRQCGSDRFGHQQRANNHTLMCSSSIFRLATTDHERPILVVDLWEAPGGHSA